MIWHLYGSMSLNLWTHLRDCSEWTSWTGDGVRAEITKEFLRISPFFQENCDEIRTSLLNSPFSVFFDNRSNFSFILSTLVIITIICTSYDIWMRYHGRKQKKFSSIFSCYSNFCDLMKFTKPESTISCIDGLKVLSAIWIIVGHRRDILHEPFPTRRHGNIILWEEVAMKIFASYFYCVETFLACSAILVTHSLLRSFERWAELLFAFKIWTSYCWWFSGNFNLLKLYVARCLRYLPSIAILVMFFSSSLPQFISDGPLFNQLQHKIDVCKSEWWTNILFVNNYVVYLDGVSRSFLKQWNLDVADLI